MQQLSKFTGFSWVLYFRQKRHGMLLYITQHFLFDHAIYNKIYDNAVHKHEQVRLSPDKPLLVKACLNNHLSCARLLTKLPYRVQALVGDFRLSEVLAVYPGPTRFQLCGKIMPRVTDLDHD